MRQQGKRMLQPKRSTSHPSLGCEPLNQLLEEEPRSAVEEGGMDVRVDLDVAVPARRQNHGLVALPP